MIYWQALNEEGKELASGNIPLTVEEVEAWGDSMEYIENLVLDRLNLTKNNNYDYIKRTRSSKLSKLCK